MSLGRRLTIVWATGATLGVLAVVAIVALVAGSRTLPTGSAALELEWSDRQDTLWVGIPVRVRFALPANLAAEGPALLETAFAEIRRVGDAFNAFDPASEVGRFNRESGLRPFVPSREFAELLRRSEYLWRTTDGAFDVTVWPLKTLWRRAVKEGVPPAPDDLAAAIARVGTSRLAWTTEGAIAPADPPAALDFGAVVKGHAVDRVAALLRSGGAMAGLIQVGGEIRAFGASPDGRPWRVGVQDPLSDKGVEGVVTATDDLAISTSGNYQQPLRIGGKDYYHIVDPRTGQPVETRILGVTVLVEPGDGANATADALATGLAVLGPERGLALVESLPGVGALFLVRGDDGRTLEKASSRMAARYRRGLE